MSELDSDVIFTIRGKQVFKSKSAESADVIFTIRGRSVYKGNSENQRDILCTFKDGKFYNKNWIYPDEVLANYSGVATMNDIIIMIYLILFEPKF